MVSTLKKNSRHGVRLTPVKTIAGTRLSYQTTPHRSNHPAPNCFALNAQKLESKNDLPPKYRCHNTGASALDITHLLAADAISINLLFKFFMFPRSNPATPIPMSFYFYINATSFCSYFWKFFTIKHNFFYISLSKFWRKKPKVFLLNSFSKKKMLGFRQLKKFQKLRLQPKKFRTTKDKKKKFANSRLEALLEVLNPSKYTLDFTAKVKERLSRKDGKHNKATESQDPQQPQQTTEKKKVYWDNLLRRIYKKPTLTQEKRQRFLNFLKKGTFTKLRGFFGLRFKKKAYTSFENPNLKTKYRPLVLRIPYLFLSTVFKARISLGSTKFFWDLSARNPINFYRSFRTVSSKRNFLNYCRAYSKKTPQVVSFLKKKKMLPVAYRTKTKRRIKSVRSLFFSQAAASPLNVFTLKSLAYQEKKKLTLDLYFFLKNENKNEKHTPLVYVFRKLYSPTHKHNTKTPTLPTSVILGTYKLFKKLRKMQRFVLTLLIDKTKKRQKPANFLARVRPEVKELKNEFWRNILYLRKTLNLPRSWVSRPPHPFSKKSRTPHNAKTSTRNSRDAATADNVDVSEQTLSKATPPERSFFLKTSKQSASHQIKPSNLDKALYSSMKVKSKSVNFFSSSASDTTTINNKVSGGNKLLHLDNIEIFLNFLKNKNVAKLRSYIDSTPDNPRLEALLFFKLKFFKKRHRMRLLDTSPSSKKINFFTYRLLRRVTTKQVRKLKKKPAPVWLKNRKLNFFWFRLNRSYKNIIKRYRLVFKRFFRFHLKIKKLLVDNAFDFKKRLTKFLNLIIGKRHRRRFCIKRNQQTGEIFKNYVKRKRQIYKKKRIATFNLKKPLIKVFWKSQRQWREYFFRKKRWTARKFKNYFESWYKKNKPNPGHALRKKEKTPQLWALTIRLNLFLSKKDCDRGISTGLLFVNCETPLSSERILLKNDIVSLPPQHLVLKRLLFKKRLLVKKIIRRNQYIYFRNKESRWKSLRKQYHPFVQCVLYTKKSIPGWSQYDPITSTIAIVKRPKRIYRVDRSQPRHALERLNTWRLRI